MLPKHEGIAVRSQLSDYDIEVVIDLSQIKLNEFIKKVNEESVISDMSIEGLELEYIIKDLYQV
jgi:hypothetical protein